MELFEVMEVDVNDSEELVACGCLCGLTAGAGSGKGVGAAD